METSGRTLTRVLETAPACEPALMLTVAFGRVPMLVAYARMLTVGLAPTSMDALAPTLTVGAGMVPAMAGRISIRGAISPRELACGLRGTTAAFTPAAV
jgi:hypothetical protein